MLIKFLTGHVELKKQLFRIGQEVSPMCDCGEEDESSDHFVLRCKIYGALRFIILGDTEIDEDEASKLRICDYWKFIRNSGRLLTNVQ